MKKSLLLLSVLAAGIQTISAGVPDSVFVRSYSNPDGDGLHLEWSTARISWEAVSPERILSSDYGTWGWGKKMFAPSITKGYDGVYVLVFQPVKDGKVNQFGLATTKDFVHWRPQDFPYMKGLKECRNPQVVLKNGAYEVRFESAGKWYASATSDLKHFGDPVVSTAPDVAPLCLSASAIEGIKASMALTKQQDAKFSEKSADDKRRFEGLQQVEATVVVDGGSSKAISDKLIGIFFEDINYSADGGLYAELVENRDFEYNNSDHNGWNSLSSWKCVGEGLNVKIMTDSPIHANNAHYAVLTVADASKASFQNTGFEGIVVRRGEKYDLSLFTKALAGNNGKVNVVLRDENDAVIGKTQVAVAKNDWKQQSAVIQATADCNKARLCIEPSTVGEFALDFVSLFPQKTFRGHKNGLRKDLAETLEALHPQFMRFPGGCVTHGNGIDNIYRWKETIGPLWERKSQPNIWGYHQSKGLGFYEYFQFCEDLKMEPLPVLSAGVPCQNSSWGGNGQQGGIPMEQMDAYIQEILDLIEWANGDAKTTEWGKKRAQQGHPKPFNLHYLGIGNEDLISPTFEERYLAIINAVKAKYPDIIICGTVGPFFKGSDYEDGWRIARENKIDMVDEHYYCSPGWYIHNQHYYDQYDRTESKVYLGEYAAHGDGRKSTIETALACALHICSLERNGDVVELSSYAPLLAKHGHTQWNPDMIYFNNSEVFPTVDYYSQMMAGQHAGDTYISSKITANERREGVNERLAVSTVKDSKSGKTYLKIVSMMPVVTKAHLQLSNLGITAEKTCHAIVLKGEYNSMDARPEDTNFVISEDCTIDVAPYSFTIIEL